MSYIKIENDKIKHVNLPDSFGTTFTGYATKTDLHAKDGFFKKVYPDLQENERHLPFEVSDCDKKTGLATCKKEQIPQPTAQELHDALQEEGKVVFDDYRRLLNEAASPYNILGNHPIELKYLTEQLLVVKDEIDQGLAHYLATNDIENLKNFNFNDERAEQLKAALESFK